MSEDAFETLAGVTSGLSPGNVTELFDDDEDDAAFDDEDERDEESEAIGDRLPEHERDLTVDQLGELWEHIEQWRETFPAITRAFPPCWVRHRALRQEALALAHGWELVRWKKMTALTWLDELERSLHRCQQWSSGCDESYHRPDENVAAVQAASRAWLDQERAERAQAASPPTGPTGPAAGSGAWQPQGSTLAQHRDLNAPAGR